MGKRKKEGGAFADDGGSHVPSESLFCVPKLAKDVTMLDF